MTHNVLKRTLAGVLAVACAAGFAPANSISPVNFADSSIIASAEEKSVNFVRSYLPPNLMTEHLGEGCSKEEATEWIRNNIVFGELEEDAYFIYGEDSDNKYEAVIVNYIGKFRYTTLSYSDIQDLEWDDIHVYWCADAPKSVSDNSVFQVGDVINFGNGTYILDRWYDEFEARKFNGIWIVEGYEYWTDHYYIRLFEPDSEGGGESTYIHVLMEEQAIDPTSFTLSGGDGETAKTPLKIELQFDVTDGSISLADITMAENSADVEDVSYNGYTLTAGVDYSVTYKDSTGKAIAKPTAAGAGRC